TPEMRTNEAALRRTVREFLIVLSIARGLFVRLDEFNRDDARQVRERLHQMLEATAARIERIAADPAAWSDPYRLRRQVLTARSALKSTAAELESMAGKAPFAPLADGLLILNRVRDLLHSLAMVVVPGAASRRNRSTPARPRRHEQRDSQGRMEALLVA